MAKLTCTEKAWDNARPASVKKTGLSEAIAKALKAMPGGDPEKLGSTDACDKARAALQTLEEVLATAYATVSKAKDDKKDAAGLVKGWRTETGKVIETLSERKIALVEAVIAPVVKRWAAPRRDLEKKVLGVIENVRHADNNMGHSEQMRDEAVMAMVERASKLRETGAEGTEPKDFLGDQEFKAMYESWDDMIELAIKSTKEIEAAVQQSSQLKKIIQTMYNEIEATAKEVGDGLKLDSTAIKEFNAFRKDAVEFAMESASDGAAKYATFAFIADPEPSSGLRSKEEKALVTRFNKIGKIDAESYFENKLAVYGLNEARLKKTLISVKAAGEQVTKLAKTLRSGVERDPKTVQMVQALVKGLDDTNARLVKARNNMEVVQALSKDVNKPAKQRITQALQYVAKVTEEADQTLKEFA